MGLANDEHKMTKQSYGVINVQIIHRKEEIFFNLA